MGFQFVGPYLRLECADDTRCEIEAVCWDSHAFSMFTVLNN